MSRTKNSESLTSIDQDEGSEWQCDGLQWKHESTGEERESRPHRPEQLQQRSPTIAGRGQASAIPVSTYRCMTSFLNNTSIIQRQPFNAIVSCYFSYFPSSQDNIWVYRGQPLAIFICNVILKSRHLKTHL